MSGIEKSVAPIRQLSLQAAAPRRQQIRRQRSAENDKPLQISASPFASGKRGTSAKPCSERPKVRVAWKENRQKNGKELEQVEVVARQIPGRSRPITGKSRAFTMIDKPSILYSRQELAERLRLAWKHREENKANINIFLAHGTFDERCNSEMSCHTASSSPTRKNNEIKIEIPSTDNYETMKDEKDKEIEEVISKRWMETALKKNANETSTDFKHSSTERERTVRLKENEIFEDTRIEREKTDAEKEQTNEISRDTEVEYLSNTKKFPASIDCSNSRVPSTTTLPSITIENSALEVAKVSKEDFSSAKQKRASFHSGTNRAFLDPIRSPTEFKRSSVSDKGGVHQRLSTDGHNTSVEHNLTNRAIRETKENITNEKTATGKSTCGLNNERNVTQKIIVDNKLTSTNDKNAHVKTVIESKDVSADDKTATRKTVIEEENGCVDVKAVSSRNSSEARCSSVNGRSSPLKKMTENRKNEQKSRRTNSAPPQRHSESASTNNRVQVNIVIDSTNTLISGKDKNREKSGADCKDNTVEKIDTASAKVPPVRSVRSATLKRRSRSAKRRFWGGGSCKNDEDGKPRNRLTGRARNSIDSRTIDIVTMVSLVSSADSDSDTENSPGDDKLINELRSKLPTTSIIKTSINSALSTARKPIKSVSFHRDSVDEDSPKKQQPPPKEEKRTTQPRLAIVRHESEVTPSCKETVSWRTDTIGLALPVLALIRNVDEEALDVPLTDREKRCLAVPIGDLHDNKRKLLKTRSTPSRSGIEKQTISQKIKTQESSRIIPQKMEVYTQQTNTSPNNSPANVKSTFVPSLKETAQHSTTIEPQFQTNKEKECWHLYRKMCDKGVCISFDTVLRGMLTPTEYRLRQKEVSQNL